MLTRILAVVHKQLRARPFARSLSKSSTTILFYPVKMFASAALRGRSATKWTLSFAAGATPFYTSTLTAKRSGEAGRGGRMSEAGCKVALFGASGFLGNFVCAELGANGVMAYLANRGDDMEMRDRKVSFDLGRMKNVFYSPRDPDSIREVIADADVVVNMIGKYYESGQPAQIPKFPYLTYKTNFSFEDVNVTIARTIAEICKEMQVDHLIHVSSASANPNSKSRWSRTKYEGELAVKEAFPWATIIRPTQMFGKNDFFLSWFAKYQQDMFLRFVLGFVPMIYDESGHVAVTQPVYAGDVAQTILYCCDDPGKFQGRQIDCFGPHDYTRQELYKFVNDITDRNPLTLTVPSFYMRHLAKILQYTRNPLITPDLVEVFLEDFKPTLPPDQYKLQPDTKDKILTMADLGIEATPLEKEAFNCLHFYRFGGHFYRVQGYHLEEK